MDIIKKKTKNRQCTHNDEPGLILSRQVGRIDRDSVYIGDDLKISVVYCSGNQVKLKFFNLKKHNVQVDRAEERDKANATK